MEIKIPALSQKTRQERAPSRIKMRKGWASPQMCDPNEVVTALRTSAELRQRIIRDIGSFTVALFAISDKKIELARTGTLLTFGGLYYILTAAHVWEEKLRFSAKVGIAIAEDIVNKFSVDTRTLVPCGPPRPTTWGEWGPDMTFLRVLAEHLASIKARRVFYNPTVDGVAVLNLTTSRFGY
jgi:hypothetical protein